MGVPLDRPLPGVQRGRGPRRPAPRRAAPTAPAGPGLAIATSGLTKRFGSVTAVDRVDLEVPSGSVFGFLGPNGSGKTTTIRMLMGLINPTSGGCEVLGEAIPSRVDAALPRVGALIEGPAFYPWLSGVDNLKRLDRAGPDGQASTRVRRVDEALARVGLTNAARKKYRTYSLGMRQRLGLASALLRPRDLLVLDEPTNGMDPQGTREIRHLIRELADEGTTVFLSSHLLSEVEQVCTHVAVMSKGRLVTQGPLSDLDHEGGARLRVEVDDVVRAGEILDRLGVTDLRVEPPRQVMVGTLGSQQPDVCNRELVLAGVAVRGLSVERPSLEDLYVSLTGEGFDVEH